LERNLMVKVLALAAHFLMRFSAQRGSPYDAGYCPSCDVRRATGRS
jgi:hypothetical protein